MTTTHRYDNTILADERATVCRNPRQWSRHRTHREMSRNTRIYVHADADFDALEHLANRTRRPFASWRAALKPILAELGISTKGMRWSQYAGCTCPCSPGFVLTELVRDENGRGCDFGIILHGAPTVDHDKPARTV